ncbi:MAG: 16S rRNA methyltransferase [Anaerolineae bacterium]|jgi:16S rRNA (guanine(1405)-N(7))-methyltransferase|nr:16S rRNA methyltransferase [Chloroflexota bacterium]
MSEACALQSLVEHVRAAAPYRHVDTGLVERLAREALAMGLSGKDALKQTRRRLHQVATVYQARPQYPQWLERLRAARQSGDPALLREACRTIMGAHQSSRERLPILERFYSEIMQGLAPVRSVLDLACGLGPLAVPWMPLATGAHYWARDIFTDLTDFVGAALPLLGVQGDAATADLLQGVSAPRAQVALLLKTIPCLEQLDRNVGPWLLRQVPAERVVVTFPTSSLGGRRDRGMISNYRARMEQICAELPWPVREVVFASELAYLVDKRDDGPKEDVHAL